MVRYYPVKSDRTRSSFEDSLMPRYVDGVSVRVGQTKYLEINGKIVAHHPVHVNKTGRYTSVIGVVTDGSPDNGRDGIEVEPISDASLRCKVLDMLTRQGHSTVLFW